MTDDQASLVQTFFYKCWGRGHKWSGNVVLILTWERAGGRASQNAPDLHLQPADGKCATGMQAGEILLTLQTNHVIFLTGTKRPRTHCSPVTHSVLAGYRLFEWGYGMGRGTNRHAGLIVAVKIDLCEIWQIREVASPDASVQGRGRSDQDQNGETRSFADGALPPPIGDWATDRIYDWADKMVNAAPSRCCTVVGGDLNAHVGYVRHPEREALDLEREVMARLWKVSPGGSELQRRAPGQVLQRSTHGDGKHILSQRRPYILERNWEGEKSHPGWITFCFRPRDFSWSSIASSSEERAAIFSSFPIDAHVTTGHWW